MPTSPTDGNRIAGLDQGEVADSEIRACSSHQLGSSNGAPLNSARFVSPVTDHRLTSPSAFMADSLRIADWKVRPTVPETLRTRSRGMFGPVPAVANGGIGDTPRTVPFARKARQYTPRATPWQRDRSHAASRDSRLVHALRPRARFP